MSERGWFEEVTEAGRKEGRKEGRKVGEMRPDDEPSTSSHELYGCCI